MTEQSASELTETVWRLSVGHFLQPDCLIRFDKKNNPKYILDQFLLIVLEEWQDKDDVVLPVL